MVDLALALFRLCSSLGGLPSPFLRFEGLAPRRGDSNAVRESDVRRTNQMPRFPRIAAPIRVLDDGKPLDLPVSITVAKFIEVCLHNVREVGGGLRGLLCPRPGVESEAVKFIPCLLRNRHECLDPRLQDWTTILIGEEPKPWGDLATVALSFCMLHPVFLMPMVNIWVIFLIQWW